MARIPLIQRRRRNRRRQQRQQPQQAQGRQQAPQQQAQQQQQAPAAATAPNFPSGAEALRRERITTNLQQRASQRQLAPQFGQLTQDISRFRADQGGNVPLPASLRERRADLHTMRTQGLTPDQFERQGIERQQLQANVGRTQAESAAVQNQGRGQLLEGVGSAARGVGAITAPVFDFMGQRRQAQAQERVAQSGVEQARTTGELGVERERVRTAPDLQALEMGAGRDDLAPPGFRPIPQAAPPAPVVLDQGQAVMTPGGLVTNAPPQGQQGQQEAPVEVLSEEEALMLPPGTLVRLNGEVFRVEE